MRSNPKAFSIQFIELQQIIQAFGAVHASNERSGFSFITRVCFAENYMQFIFSSFRRPYPTYGASEESFEIIINGFKNLICILATQLCAAYKTGDRDIHVSSFFFSLHSNITVLLAE